MDPGDRRVPDSDALSLGHRGYGQVGAEPGESPGLLNVAHIIHSLGAGGAEAVLAELARAAPLAGLRPIIIGLSDAHSGADVDRRAVSQLRDCGATVYEMQGARYSPGLVMTLAKVLRDERVDIVHTHLKHADVVGGAAARLVRLPSVSTLHVIEVPTSWAHRLRVDVAVQARRRLSRTVIALSTEQRRWYSRYAGPDAPITILPNGVAEPNVTQDRASIRTQLAVPEDAAFGLCVSLMRPEKGHADLLEAIRQLPDDPPVVLALAGDGPLLHSVRATVESDLGLRSRTHVLGYRHDIANLLAACDFVVQPSLEDALPTALIAALAAGRPIVGTNVGGIPDIVAPGCGFLVDAGDPSALRAGIAQMVQVIHNDVPALAAMRRAARERYESHFSAQVWVQNLRRVYEKAIDMQSESRICSPA